MTRIEHARTADRLSKFVAGLEAARKDIADVLRHDSDGARDKVLAELGNTAHEMQQHLITLRDHGGTRGETLTELARAMKAVHDCLHDLRR